jgi:hypothetical protein
MAERPIIFSPPMVKAIIEGRKTQTRRVLRHPHAVIETNAPCPLGKPGDRLWVRERHCFLDVSKSAMSQFPLGPENNNARGPDVWNLSIEYSDGTQDETSVEGEKPKQTRARGETRWRPGIHMPRWACRLVLEITNVRAERLQDISVWDCEAEGCGHVMPKSAQEVYRELWDSLNAKRGFGWETNPWVWVIEFKRLPHISALATS